MCHLSDNIYDYHFVSQGKVTVPTIDDKEEMQFTHVGICKVQRFPVLPHWWKYHIIQQMTVKGIENKTLMNMAMLNMAILRNVTLENRIMFTPFL